MTVEDQMDARHKADLERTEARTEATKAINKAGTKTSEFWLTMVLQAVGLGLIAYGTWKGSEGLIEFGGVLMAVTGGTYSLSRGNAKKAVGFLLAGTLCITLAGCGAPGYVKASAIEKTLLGVADRHDVYTMDDTQLDDLHRRTNLRDTALLRKLLKEAQAADEEAE